jgi:hypothetical protein
MPRYSRTAVLSGRGVPSLDQRISTTMSKALGGSMESWKCPEASIASCSQRYGSIDAKCLA